MEPVKNSIKYPGSKLRADLYDLMIGGKSVEEEAHSPVKDNTGLVGDGVGSEQAMRGGSRSRGRA